MIITNFRNESSCMVAYGGLWQYDYGQKLRIQGITLPTAVEIHFSLQETGGESVTRVGVTKDGVTDVPIPDSMMENNGTNRDYKIYAFIYLTDETSGETIRKIVMPVRSRPKPEAFDTPEDAELFREAIAAVNEAVEKAKAAVTPTIGDNGNWFINGEDTGKPSVGEGGGASSWNDLTDKPFYTEYGDFFPETELTGNEDDGFMYPNAVEGIEIGKTYTVTYNGVEYECVAESFESDGASVIVLGNGSMLGLTETSDPFIINIVPPEYIASMGAGLVAMPLDGSTSVTLSISGDGAICHPIETKYIEKMNVTITRNNTGTAYEQATYSCNKTYAEVYEAIQKNVPIYVSFIGTDGIFGSTMIGNYYSDDIKAILFVFASPNSSFTGFSLASLALKDDDTISMMLSGS